MVAITIAMSVADVAYADGSGSAVVAVDAGASDASPPPDAGTPSSVQPLPSPEDLMKSFYKAVTTKDWFMLAGAVIAVIIALVRWGLIKRWPKWEESHYGVLLAALISGLTAVSLAWLASESVDNDTLLGGLKLFAAATFAYVVPKKVLEASPPASA